MSDELPATYTPRENRQIKSSLIRIERKKSEQVGVYNQYDVEFLRSITKQSHPMIWEELLDSPTRQIRLKQLQKDKPERDPVTVMCEGVDKNGFRCGAYKKKDGLCNFHNGIISGHYQKLQRDLTLTEHLREVVREGYAEEVLMPVLDALNAKKTYKEDGILYESEYPDHDVRLKAHQIIMERLEGKAEQTHKLTGNVQHEHSLADFMPEATDIVEAEFEELEDNVD